MCMIKTKRGNETAFINAEIITYLETYHDNRTIIFFGNDNVIVDEPIEEICRKINIEMRLNKMGG